MATQNIEFWNISHGSPLLCYAFFLLVSSPCATEQLAVTDTRKAQGEVIATCHDTNASEVPLLGCEVVCFTAACIQRPGVSSLNTCT